MYVIFFVFRLMYSALLCVANVYNFVQTITTEEMLYIFIIKCRVCVTFYVLLLTNYSNKVGVTVYYVTPITSDFVSNHPQPQITHSQSKDSVHLRVVRCAVPLTLMSVFYCDQEGCLGTHTCIVGREHMGYTTYVATCINGLVHSVC